MILVMFLEACSYLSVYFTTCRYLTQNPGDQSVFPKFHEVPLGDLRANAAFNAQTKTVIDAIGNIVDNLSDLQGAANFLRARVRTHNPRGIHIAQFEVRTVREFGIFRVFFGLVLK